MLFVGHTGTDFWAVVWPEVFIGVFIGVALGDSTNVATAATGLQFAFSQLQLYFFNAKLLLHNVHLPLVMAGASYRIHFGGASRIAPEDLRAYWGLLLACVDREYRRVDLEKLCFDPTGGALCHRGSPTVGVGLHALA